MNYSFGLIYFAIFSLSVCQQPPCLKETNDARASQGLSSYAHDSYLAGAAAFHNNYMITNNCFSHQCPGEPDLGDRCTKAGYNWTAVAENIAASYDDCKGVVAAWRNSPGHNKNLMGNYMHVACAFQKCSNCSESSYCTCVYGNR